MANRRKLTYIVGFIVLCWVGIAVLIGIFMSLAHVLKNTTATIIVFQLVIYSCIFGVLGSLLYKWKRERDGWRF
jgi:predicted membrane channel-forming protein YqfA (hemolysin III family)